MWRCGWRHGLDSALVWGLKDAHRLCLQLGTGLYLALLGWECCEVLGLGCK